MQPGHSLGTPTRPEVRWRVQAHGMGLRGVTPLTDIATAVAWRGERPRRAVTKGILVLVLLGP